MSELAFFRMEVRKARKKMRLDCGHVIDGSEPHRYQVWKMKDAKRIEQLDECEFCARRDNDRG